MKPVYLNGGINWESTASYYWAINEALKVQLRGLHSAKIILISVGFAKIAEYQKAGNWQQAARLHSAAAAVNLQTAGADSFIICTRTIHNVADIIQGAMGTPLLPIADATGQRLPNEGVTKTALCGH
ncbi:MAG: aspartate racemase [Paraglaciecola sp.]|jgi:aspartate racemase